MTDAGIIRSFVDEIDVLRAERDKFKQAFLEGSDKVVELRRQLDQLDLANQTLSAQNTGLAEEIERLLVELTHRVGWEERCLRAEADVLEGAEHDREIMNGQSAEIERLTSEIERQHNLRARDHGNYMAWLRQRDEAQAEVERLQALLKQHRICDCGRNDFHVPTCTVFS